MSIRRTYPLSTRSAEHEPRSPRHSIGNVIAAAPKRQRASFLGADRSYGAADALTVNRGGTWIAMVAVISALAIPTAVTAAPPAKKAGTAAKPGYVHKPARRVIPKRPVARAYTCPLCSTQARAIGHDGKSSPRRYSDLEVPTRAYTNLVVACPKCGYAAWSQDFESRASGAAQHYTRRYLARTAKRAAQSPLLAYQHHMNLLHVRRASLHEQIGAALFYTYVLKRGRPYGGMDPKLEQRIRKARKRALALLTLALKKSPPTDQRTNLEWSYLQGELKRLTGDTTGALPLLQKVCWARKQAGYTVGRLSCQMTERAKRSESFEDYRDGVTDVREIASAIKQAKLLAAQTEKEAKKRAAALAKAKKLEAQAEQKRADSKATQSPVAERAPTSKDPYAPAPPPVVK